MRRPGTRLANRRPPSPAASPAVPDVWAAPRPVDVGPRALDVAPDASRRHVLVADGRRDVVAEVSFHLARAGFRVTTAATGAEAVTAMRLREPALVVAGDALAGVTAAEIVRRLRTAPDGGDVGALLLTDPSAGAAARIDALTVGADDCVAWPGDARELVLRAGAVVRRYARVRPRADEALRHGPLAIDVGRAEVTVDGTRAHFTRTEFDLLWILARHPGQLFTRDQLTALTWGAAAAAGRRRVDRHVHFIREKLGPLGAWIETVSRQGYRFTPPAEGGVRRRA
jgi:two-component system phosphate regulon response regulator PhoB